MWWLLACGVHQPAEVVAASPPPRSTAHQVSLGDETVTVWSPGDVSVLDPTATLESLAVSGDGDTLVFRDLGPGMNTRLQVVRGGRREVVGEPVGFFADPSYVGRFGDVEVFVTTWSDVRRRETLPRWGVYAVVVGAGGVSLVPWLVDGSYVSYVAVDPGGTRLATVVGDPTGERGDEVVVRPMVRGDGPIPSLGEPFSVLADPPPQLAVRNLVFDDRGSLFYNWAPSILGDVEWHVSTVPAAPGGTPTDLPGVGWVITFQPTSPSFVVGTLGAPGELRAPPARLDTGAQLLACDPPHRCEVLAFSPAERALYATVWSSSAVFHYAGVLRVGW